MSIEVVWSEYRSKLKAFLHTKIANPADVDDILQEVLIKSHNNISHLKKEESLSAWLFQIANRTVIDFYRKNSRQQGVSEWELWDEYEEPVDIQKDLSKCIEPFIQALSKEEAELLTAIDIEGRSQKDYAEELDVAYSTLKSRVQKSRNNLRKLFDQCCEYTLDKHGGLVSFDSKADGCKNC